MDVYRTFTGSRFGTSNNDNDRIVSALAVWNEIPVVALEYGFLFKPPAPATEPVPARPRINANDGAIHRLQAAIQSASPVIT